MAEGTLTPRVIDSHTTTVVDRQTGKVTRVARVTFVLGELGPFVEDIPAAELSRERLQTVFEERARVFRDFT